MCARVCVFNGFVGFSERIDGYICAGNPTLPLKSPSGNYVGHLGRPEKLVIIYAFTRLECPHCSCSFEGLSEGNPAFKEHVWGGGV